jgi:chemotaxis protein CheD
MLYDTPTTTPLPAQAPALTPPPVPSAAPAAYVHPGKIATTAGPESFTTVVASGVVVCVWDPVRHVGGLAHFLLPDSSGAEPAPRYGDVALRWLLDQLAALGGRSYRASIHGGSPPPIEIGTGHIGERNVAAAVAFLALRGIRIVERDVGGLGTRMVTFTPSTGTAEVQLFGER